MERRAAHEQAYADASAALPADSPLKDWDTAAEISRWNAPQYRMLLVGAAAILHSDTPHAFAKTELAELQSLLDNAENVSALERDLNPYIHSPDAWSKNLSRELLMSERLVRLVDGMSAGLANPNIDIDSEFSLEANSNAAYGLLLARGLAAAHAGDCGEVRRSLVAAVRVHDRYQFPDWPYFVSTLSQWYRDLHPLFSVVWRLDDCPSRDALLAELQGALSGYCNPDLLRLALGGDSLMTSWGLGPEQEFTLQHAVTFIREQGAWNRTLMAPWRDLRNAFDEPLHQAWSAYTAAHGQLTQELSPLHADFSVNTAIRAHRDMNEICARIAAIGVARALFAYKDGHGGYPDSLEAIDDGNPELLVCDPLTGQPAVYEKMGDGFRLYLPPIPPEDALTIAGPYVNTSTTRAAPVVLWDATD